jgi:hypothetical protein
MMKSAIAFGLMVCSLTASAEQKFYPIDDSRYSLDLSAPRTPWEKKFYPRLRRAFLNVNGFVKDKPVFEMAYVLQLVAPRMDCGFSGCEQGSIFAGSGTLYLGIPADRDRNGSVDALHLFDIGKINADNTVDFMRDIRVSPVFVEQRCSKKEKKSGCRDFDSIQVELRKD